MAIRNLDANAHYLVTNLDPAGPLRELVGRELTESGLPVSLNEQPSCLVLTYRKVR